MATSTGKGKRATIPQRITASAPDRLRGSGDTWRGAEDKRATSSSARGYGYRWQCERAEYLLDNPLCVIRGPGCTLAACIVDHVKPHGGSEVLFWDHANWQGSCKHCHDAHKQRAEHGARYSRAALLAGKRAGGL